MNNLTKKIIQTLLIILPIITSATTQSHTRTGRVLVVANSKSPASLELAKIYRTTHHLPEQNLLQIPFDNQISISKKDFQKKLMTPIINRYNQLFPAIDYVVLMLGVPYRVDKYSTTSAIMYGGIEKITAAQNYFGQSRPFESSIPCQGRTLLPATIISAYTLQEAEALIKRSQIHYPDPSKAGIIYLCDGQGPRSIRKSQIPLCTMALASNLIPVKHIRNHNIYHRKTVIAQMTGHTTLQLNTNKYLPGSILDNLTSYGGKLLEDDPQISILTFIQHGVCGSYGTVSEPTNDPKRWATYGLPIQYLKGYNLVESYLQTTYDPSLAVILGDPLMAPFAKTTTPQLKLPKTIPPNQPLTITITIPKQNQPTPRIECWLDDQQLIYTYQPQIPADTICTLEIKEKTKQIFNYSIKCKKQVTPQQLLKHLSSKSTPTIQLIPGGKHHNKLLIRWQPTPKNQYNYPRTAQATITIKNKNNTTTIHNKLRTNPIAVRSIIYNFGSQQPKPNDSFTTTHNKLNITLTANKKDTIKTMLTRLIKQLKQQPEYQQNSPYKIKLQQTPTKTGKYTYQLITYATSPTTPYPTPLTIKIQKTRHSKFAHNKIQGKQQIISLGLLAETTLTTQPKTYSLKQTLTIPCQKLCPGKHFIRTITLSPTDSQQIQTHTFDITNPKKLPQLNITLNKTTINPNQPLQITINTLPNIPNSQTHIFIDNRHLTTLPNLHNKTITCHLSPQQLSPGTHTIHMAIYQQNQYHLLKPSFPICKSKTIPFYIKRPLLSDAKFSPNKQTAGISNKINFSGPYLHNNLTYKIDDKIIKCIRNQKNGHYWTADIGDLPAGTYTISIHGDTQTEISGNFNKKLTILPR